MNKKLDAILIITNQCNLNCAYCVYACDIPTSPYCINLENLSHTIKLMKDKLPSLKKIILSGGDPFMHPQIVQICEKIREYFPTIELCAYTNGLLLKKLSDEDIIVLTQKLHLNISTSLYPSLNNLKIYKEQEERFKNLNSSLYYQSSHFYFTKNNYKNHNINLPKELIYNRFKQKCRTITKYNQLITIYQNKILICCGEVGFVCNNKNTDISDLLDLETLSSEQEIYDFCENPHNICKDCIANEKLKRGFVLWQRKSALTERYQENTIETIFSRNYGDYKKLILNNQEHLQCLNDKFYSEKFILGVNPGEAEYLNTKYKNGIGDIFIPYQGRIPKDKRLQLLKRIYQIDNIEKYNLYFVGINAGVHGNQLMFKQFSQGGLDSKLKITFLQGDNLLQGYKEFLHYSYLNNKIILDIDEFINSNKTTFE